VRRDLGNLTAELKLRAQQAVLRLDEEENRAVWATLLLTVMAIAVGLGVMAMATRTLRPLQRLAERAKQIARGDYQQRVDASSPDEIGALGREFNAMAAALDEREQRLIRSERLAAVGKIAAQITHEVRNPLSSIGLNAELLEEELAGGSSESQALARAIVKEVDRLTEITEEYLRFARLPRPRLEREDVGELVASLLGFLKGELDERGVAVEARLGAGLPQVAADEHQLRQALLNLMRNAAEAMSAGGRLEVSLAAEAQSVALRIRDSGQGIAAEHLDKIFDPFFSTKDGGTGLGLALTQQIVVEHGGTIEVESALGVGTTFTVRLPSLPAGEPAARAAAPLARAETSE
jgi:signal transduction histidine kinase